MQPYQKYSFEELRLADYNAGRQFGNGSGQAGAFGSSTFGGFGASNTGGAFGSNTTTTTSTPFGGASSSTGFGTNSSGGAFGGSGGLFGNTAAKPAGGLFGQQSSGATTGGLFGTSNNNTSTFGSNTNAGGFGGNTGGGLFGNANQNQTKPAAFGTSTTGTGFTFGNTNPANTSTNTGGGLFGNNHQSNTTQSGGLFGGSNNNTGGGLFGNNQNQQKPLFGAPNNTQAPASGGLFGTSTNTSNTSGGLFGNNNNQSTNTGGGLFGSSTTNTGGGLFGSNNTNNNAAKPGGLFGGGAFGSTGTANTGGGLFGNNNNNAANNQQQGGGGLFGGNTGGGFSFGNSTASKPTTSLFGNTSTNNQAGGLFGSTNQNNTSLFGNSQNNQQNAQQQDGVKHSSLLDPNPYGQSSIWTGLPAPTTDNAKPVVTPLIATQKLKESSAKPISSLRVSQSRYMTPPRRNGFGFTYSTYGTPNSAASTPGGGSLSSSMYGSRSFTGGSFGRSMSKSASVSNLRSQFGGESDGIFAPGALAPTARYSGGSIRRLTIDRSIRTDLFSRPSLPALPAPKPVANGTSDSASNGAKSPERNAEPQAPAEPVSKLKKRVSFDKDTTGGQNGELNSESGALVRTETDDDDTSQEQTSRGRSMNSASADRSEQARGNELAAVPEDRESHDVSSNRSEVQAKSDPKPGDYWMKPSRGELSRMPREKLQRFTGFQVGRRGYGQVTFDEPVDLTQISLDDVYEKIVEIRLRSVTVYPDSSSKPPVGKGLNVPSTISIENSWPRARGQPTAATSGPTFDKHVSRLKKMPGTEFTNYEASTGVWTFKVPHYTRYGLDYDEDDDEDDMDQSELSPPPDTIDGKQADSSVMEVDADYDDSGAEDDTFAFKQKVVPGGFGRQSAVDFDEGPSMAQSVEYDDEPADETADSDEEMSDNEPDMAGSFPPAAITAIASPSKPILKAPGTPGKPLLDLDGDWAEQLQRTISPRKQNRDILREAQSKVMLDRVYEPIKPRAINKKEFRTSIDLMNSLFNKHNERMETARKVQAGNDFEV